MKSILKKPKLEIGEEMEENSGEDENEQEGALVALIEHRTKEVENLKNRFNYYKSQLEQAEKKLRDSKSELARLRSRDHSTGSEKLKNRGSTDVKRECRSLSPSSTDEAHCPVETQVSKKPKLLIPAVQTPRSLNSVPDSTQPDSVRKPKGDSLNKSSSRTEIVESKDTGRKRKLEQKEHKEVISLIRSSDSPCLIRCKSDVHISSQHKRKLRSLVLNPFDDELFMTSALDGVVNLWQVRSKGSGACLLSTTDCISPKRRWPEDIAWHPQGDSLFCVYTADGGDAQVSILNLSASQQEKQVTFLEEKPHLKGIINSISFMPWDDSCFVTGGSDHGVVIWRQIGGENSWKPKALHRNLHTSAVMGVAGLQQKQIVMSAGVDKRIVGYDMVTGQADFRHQIESKCLSILPNPTDFNLFMVQTGTPGKQLRLYDIRLKQTEIHEFGWKQESSESQSALINQAWSPDGLYISSGSADPMIHIFDIRYTANVPSQSVKAHQKRVFKAVWHNSHPLLISISSDLQIGLHKIASK